MGVYPLPRPSPPLRSELGLVIVFGAAEGWSRGRNRQADGPAHGTGFRQGQATRPPVPSALDFELSAPVGTPQPTQFSVLRASRVLAPGPFSSARAAISACWKVYPRASLSLFG